MSKRIKHIIDEIADQYIEDSNKPWIIGFSGGKDLTVLLTLVWLSLLKIKNEIDEKFLKREVWLVCNDKLVEYPTITNYVNGILAKIEKAAIKYNLPFYVKKTIPRLEDSFWVNLIG